MKVSQIIRIIIFCGLFLLLSIPVTTVFIPKWTTGNTPMTRTTLGFQSLKKDSVDILYVGSSQILRGISPMTIWEEQGIAGYTRATTVMPSEVPLYYIGEALETQNIKIVVIDFSALYSSYDVDEREPYVRYAFDYMPLDLHKLRTVSEVLATSKEQTVLSYIYPLLRYHSRWQELTADDFTWLFDNDVDDVNKGAVFVTDIVAQDRDASLMEPTDEVAKYNKEAYDNYAAMIAYCKANDITVLSVRMPRTDWTYAKHNADVNFAKTYGIDYIDTNVEENFDEIGLDPAVDFIDSNHLNATGALKLSTWLGKYLKAHYDLEDTRDDPAYREWETDYEAFKESLGQ